MNATQGYRPQDIEAKHYARWEQAGWFAPSGKGEPYCIVIPPPNVTGTLHMGHAFQDTIMDALTRYHRMRGANTLWQPGTDHAGIATQMVVERLLDREGTHRTVLGRDAFVRRVWEWKEQSGNRIGEQLRRLAASVDWSRDRFTMDPGMSAAVVEVFVRLYDEGLIYRGKRLVNWDPKLHTALSDLEVLSTAESGKLWRFRYPIADAEGNATDTHLVVATTRPETMLGDTAVAVHPDDERYRHLIGRHVRLPLTERLIPVVGDDYVDPEFGTGCVKITPAHDFNDYEVGLRHNLPLINIFDIDAHLNDAVPEAYRGMDRFDARLRIIEDLDARGLFDGEKDHEMMVPRGDRSGVVVEPFLTDQWYVRTAPLAEPAIAAVASGRIRFVPENWNKTYFEWMRNIQDWCISRQLWWGHRIPAWYDNEGNIHVGRDEAEVRARYELADHVPLRQDEDVLDTWFSSALWPFSTLGWPERTRELSTFYPTSALVTGHDIIFFWVARMIMMGLKFMDDVPFRTVYVHGLIRDHEGQKMSKSKGNVLDPLDIIDGVDLSVLLAKRTDGMMQAHLKPRIEEATRREFPDGIPAYGTDAMRFTFASLATTGRDISFDLARVEGYQRFCNKLWNAAGFVFAQIEGHAREGADSGEMTIADRWIRSRMHEATAEFHTAVASYRFDLAAQTLYDFIWHEFCDWYLELTKPVLYAEDEALVDQQRSTRATLAYILGASLRLLHPIMPYITEELWLKLADHAGFQTQTIMLEAQPEESDFSPDPEADREVAWTKQFIVGIRQIRGETNLPPSKPLPVWLVDASEQDLSRARTHARYLLRLANLADIRPISADDDRRGTAVALLGEMKILVPLAGLIDVEAECDRLNKQLARVEQDLKKLERKLGNEQFVANAPPEVVAKDRGRADELALKRDQLSAQLQQLRTLS